MYIASRRSKQGMIFYVNLLESKSSNPQYIQVYAMNLNGWLIKCEIFRNYFEQFFKPLDVG